jgi:hypothetical protein
MFTGTIYDLASAAVTKFGLRSIDWAALTAQGRGSVWDRDYITQYMAPAQATMVAAVGGMTFDVGGDPVTVQKSYSVNEEALRSIASSVLPIINGPSPALGQIEVGLSREAIRYLVSHAYQASLYAFLLHADETIHHSGLSDAEIAAHANTAVGTMNALVMMRNLGLYKVLGIDQTQVTAQKGLGIAPAIVAGIVVVVVAAMCLLAWVVISAIDLTKKNAIVAKVCENAQTAGDAATTQQCVATLTDPSKNAGTMVPQAIKQTLIALVPYAFGGVAIYAMYLAAPYVIKNLLTKKASA